MSDDPPDQWVQFVGGPRDGEMVQMRLWARASSGHIVAVRGLYLDPIDEADGAYTVDGMADAELGIVLMRWRHHGRFEE